MATRTTKTSTVKAKTSKTSAPRTARARKSEATDATLLATATGPSNEAVAQRAYERFCARGYVHGFDVEDWLAAERELASA
jgi:hypothetical protein